MAASHLGIRNTSHVIRLETWPLSDGGQFEHTACYCVSSWMHLKHFQTASPASRPVPAVEMKVALDGLHVRYTLIHIFSTAVLSVSWQEASKKERRRIAAQYTASEVLKSARFLVPPHPRAAATVIISRTNEYSPRSVGRAQRTTKTSQRPSTSILGQVAA